MNYPLTFRFKIIAAAKQFSVTDSDGALLYFARQKFFKLKEDIRIYSDPTMSREVFSLKADRIIDFSPLYTVADPSGQQLASIQRNGRVSLWRADYDLKIDNAPFAKVVEENPWIKIADELVSQIPYIGLVTGYFLHPAYIVIGVNGEQIAKLTKQPALFEGVYKLDYYHAVALSEKQQESFVALLMVVLLFERISG
jgi:uncharacterized protein YxjI